MLRHNLLRLFTAAAFIAVATPGVAQVAGTDYTLLEPALPGGSNGAVDVLEFFSFGSLECHALEPRLVEWRAAQKGDVVFRRLPVSFGRPEWEALGRLYLTLNRMGLSDTLDGKVFDGVHKESLKVSDENVRNAWLGKQGVDVKKFTDLWRSFEIETELRRAEQMIDVYRSRGVPMLVVDGKYAPTDSGVQGGDAARTRILMNADQLVTKARAERSKQ